MPKTCCYCPLMGYDPDREWLDSMARTGAHICALTGELIDNTKRAEHCPLIPVPDHGRLIDADVLIDAIIAKYIRHERNRELVFAAAEIKQDLADIINELPTIISAEEGEA